MIKDIWVYFLSKVNVQTNCYRQVSILDGLGQLIPFRKPKPSNLEWLGFGEREEKSMGSDSHPYYISPH